jgi:hypothetical protein
VFGLEPNEPNPAKRTQILVLLSQLTKPNFVFFSSKLALLEELCLRTDAGADKGAGAT